MSTLIVNKFTLTTTTHGTPLVSTMKRYRSASRKCPSLYELSSILLLGHGSGFPKETWEPTLEELFRLDDTVTPTATGALRIREVWAVECQNHGEAAIVNAETLVKNPDIYDIYDYADAFASLYRSGLLGTLDSELHKVILVGHSAGSVGVTLATSYFNPPSMIPFSALILIDPPIFSPAMKGQETELYKLAEEMTPRRRDIWESREAAAKWLRARPPYATWDQRVFEIYIKYGLQPLPTPFYPDKDGVTLTTHRSGENTAFTGIHFTQHALHRLSQICDDIPVHLIYGAKDDMFTRVEKETLVNPKEDRNFASIAWIQGAGHLVVEEAPSELARSLFAILKRGQKFNVESKL